MDFKNILVYVASEDDHLMALDQAVEIAEGRDARIRILRVMPEGGVFSTWRSPNAQETLVRKLLEEAEHERLQARVASLGETSAPIEIDVRWGTPWLEIVRTVLAGKHDLVIKAAEGAARTQGLFFGSTALHLIRKCPCPVWVVGRGGVGPGRRVLAAIDPEGDEVRSAVAEDILGLADSLAQGGGELHAVTAWRAAGETLLRNRMRAGDLAGYVEAERQASLAGLERSAAAAGIALLPENLHLKKGEAADVLPRLVEELGIDVLVMGSMGRVGIAGFLIGETAEAIIRSVRCSVMVVKPPGFVSPVELPA